MKTGECRLWLTFRNFAAFWLAENCCCRGSWDWKGLFGGLLNWWPGPGGRPKSEGHQNIALLQWPVISSHLKLNKPKYTNRKLKAFNTFINYLVCSYWVISAVFKQYLKILDNNIWIVALMPTIMLNKLIFAINGLSFQDFLTSWELSGKVPLKSSNVFK